MNRYIPKKLKKEVDAAEWMGGGKAGETGKVGVAVEVL